ncbi:MAG: TonB-dependent receptor [Sphingomonadales bacterium]|nr:TonB-dependent receptor [Sphingomonadaceae bacterium]MBS3931405.1 TonB-dependent receptor [Sphingomonadales bacterium]
MKFFRKSALSSATCLQSAAFAVAMVGLPGIAQAQDAAPADSAQCADENANSICDADEKKDLVVTGSRLTRPTLVSSVPLTSVTTEEVLGTGKVSLGDALNDLPSLRSTFSSGSTARNIFSSSGLSLLDLRGLGTDRTLVLINGRRHVTSSPGDNAFDVNTIPVDLVERIDVVTGGNSAVYGSDAVAGVVNFVMKRDFDGFSVRGQAGISSRGDRGTAFVAAVYGKNFADGRGNVAFAAEYTRQNALYANQRDHLTGAYSGRCQFQLVDVTGGEPAAGDGIFDTEFMCGVRNSAVSDAGTFGAIDASTSPTRRYLRFDSVGNVVIDTPTRSFAPVGSGNQIGGLGSTLFSTGQLLAQVNRYAFNVLAHYDFSDAFSPFVEAKYVRSETLGETQPSFFTSVPGTLGGPPIRCDNGFFSAQNLNVMRSFGICGATDPAAPIAGSGGVLRGTTAQTSPLARFNVDFGGRIGSSKRETYRVVAGVKGTFNEDWKYEIALNYGRFDGKTNSRNNLYLFDINGNPDGFNIAVDAVIAPGSFTGTNFVTNSAGERVICRVNAVTNTRPDCLPVNVFGQNNNSRAVLDSIHRDGQIIERAEQFVASVNLAGDLSQLFELPGGPIGFALGAEYREEKGNVRIDALSASGGTFLNALSNFCPPNDNTDLCPDKLTVKDLYGEVVLPLVKDAPFFKELTVNGAARVSDYNNSTGTVWAWNVQGVWAPVSDLRFRAAYAASVRAPTQSDLFTAPFQNFASIADPCDTANFTPGSQRATNCAAAGVPTIANAAAVAACASTSFTLTLGGPWANCAARTQTLPFSSGGNPTLLAERGKSLTLGAVFTPSFIPGLSLTVDFYDIKVKNLIAALGAQTMLNLCYDSTTGINNPFCATVSRDPTTGLFNDPLVITGGVNFAKQHTRGIDFDVSYRKTFENGDKLAVRGIATRVMTLNNFLNPLFPNEPNRQLSELGDPLWAANLRIAYDFGPVAITYNLRYIDKQTTSAAWETQNPYYAACPTSGANAGITPNTGGPGNINGTPVPCSPGSIVRVAPNNADALPKAFYPVIVYQDVRLDFEIDKKFNFYVGVNNLMDTLPPLGELGNVGGSPYDSFGRYFYAGFEANF